MNKYILFILFFLFACNLPHHTAEKIIAKSQGLQIPYHPLNCPKDLDILLNEIDTSRIVLLGEASHGTSEFYSWRAWITKRLIEEKGFNFIAVEGDWTDSYKVNNFIRGEKKDSNAVIKVLKEYNRWPTWLWANYEVASLVQWLNNYNQNKQPKGKIGFYGLDLFNIAEAADEILPYLLPADTAALQALKKFQGCFKSYANDEQQYTKIASKGISGCKDAATRLWQTIHEMVFKKSNPTESDFVMEQNALVVFDGELYLQSAANSVDAWNLRDNHMLETIERLLQLNGKNAKAIIWAHNNHVGDAQFTTMHWEGKTNIGQLLRYKYGTKNVFIVGSGTYTGSVIAAQKWGTAYQKMQMPFADDSSWEQRLHQINAENKLLICRELKNNPGNMRWISNVGVGVLYHPMDRTGIYSVSVIPNRYDAYLFFDRTNPLHPISPPYEKSAIGNKIEY